MSAYTRNALRRAANSRGRSRYSQWPAAGTTAALFRVCSGKSAMMAVVQPSTGKIFDSAPAMAYAGNLRE